MMNFSPMNGNALRFLKKNILLILSILAAIISFSICAYYILYPSEGYLHSDCTDSLLWANASVESGAVFDPDFRYAAMLPFSASLWFIPLIWIFGYSMTAQTVGMMIFLVLFSLAAYFMCRSLEWSHTSSFCMMSALLLILSGSDKLREIMWDHVIYYSLALLVIMTGIGLVARLSKQLSRSLSEECTEADKKRALIKSAIYAALTVILFTGNGTNGFQVIALSTLAVFAAIFAERFFDGKEKLVSKKNLPAAASLALIVVSTLLGLVILKYLKGDKFANYTSVYSSFSKLEDWYGNFTAMFESYFSLIGVVAKNGTPLFAKESIPTLVRIIGGIMILVVPAVTLFRYKDIKENSTKIILWTHLAVSAVIIFGFTCGRIGSANWRATPMVGTAIMATVATTREFILSAKEEEFFGASAVKLRLGVCLCAVLILFSAVNANDIRKMPKDYGQDNALHTLADELEARGLEYGYATFWRSQAITLLSDSKVKCRETLVNADGIITDYYQSSRLWYEDQPGVDKYFVILSTGELAKVSSTSHWKEITKNSLIENFDCAGFHIYVFSENIILLGEFNG